jgi:hypothetical protein
MKYRWFVSACLLGLCLFIPSKSFGQSTVSCNSDDEKRHYCALDTRGGIRLQNQRSGSPCTEGYSWGYDEQGVWVDHGCRADFALVGRDDDYGDRDYGNRRYRQAQIISCNSDDEKRHYCPAEIRGGVRLQSQQSGSPCKEGYSWGYDDRGIWVDHGCRAIFAVGGRRGGYRNGDDGDDEYGNRRYGSPQTISCNSDDEKRHYCAADTRGSVRLQNQRSGSPCTEGYSWGYEDQGVWVDHGCRGDFVVGDRYGNRGYGSTQVITCNSNDEKRHYCTADTRGGVQLQSQQSGSPCTEGYSWGYDNQGVWVDRGCRGTFAVGAGRGRTRTRQRRWNP